MPDAETIRTDAALARPIVLDEPGQSGATIFELVSSALVDLPYGGGVVERVTVDALTLDLDEWVGVPVVFDDGETHDAEVIERDPTIQGERSIGVVTAARFDAATGERIMRISVPRKAHAAKVRQTHHAVSEAYRRHVRPPTAGERAQGVSDVQTRRFPTSLALIDYRRGGRAGPRARVRTDGADMPEAEAGSLDELLAFLKPYTSKEAKMLVKAWLGDEVAPDPKPEEPVMDAGKPEEMAALKTDAAAQRARADAAEARLLKLDAAELAADLKRAGITCDGFDAAAPTAESVAKARAARDAAALAMLRTDRASGERYTQPTNPGNSGTTVHVLPPSFS